MSSFKLLKQIDNVTKYSVHGWIREKQKQLNLQNIPSMIDAICILYFRDDERFAIINERKITLSQDGKSITRNYDEEAGLYCNMSYGMMEVDSMSNMIYEWRLRIVKAQTLCTQSTIFGHVFFKTHHIIFTITEFTGTHRMRDEEKFYEFYGASKSSHELEWRMKEPYGEAYYEGDVVTICLDLKRAEIRLNINEKVQDVAFENVTKEQGLKYRMAVTLPCNQDCVEILSFEKRIS